MAESPVLLLGGAAATLLKVRLRARSLSLSLSLSVYVCLSPPLSLSYYVCLSPTLSLSLSLTHTHTLETLQGGEMGWELACAFVFSLQWDRSPLHLKLAHIYLQSHLPTPYSRHPCFCIRRDSVYVLRLCFVQGRGALQDIDQMSLFKPLCKYCATVNTVREIVPTLRKAIQAAQSGTPGWKRFFLYKKNLILLGGGGGGCYACVCAHKELFCQQEFVHDS